MSALESGGFQPVNQRLRRKIRRTCCAAENHRWPFLNERPQGASLEGFLFPATYQLPAVEPNGCRPDCTTTGRVRRSDHADLPSSRGRWRKSAEVCTTSLILASIVEREAVLAEDRPVIAGVFLNRLANGMWLEV